MNKVFGLVVGGALALGMVAQTASADGDFQVELNVTGMTEGGWLQANLGQGNKILVTGIGWQVNLEAIDNGWLSDATFFFGSGFDPFDPDVADAAFTLRPGVGFDEAKDVL